MNANTPFPLWLIPLILVGFVVVFVLIWGLVCLLISWVGGWARLARRYRATLVPEGTDHAGVVGMIGMASYRGTLNVRTSTQGLYLTVMPLFKLGHPPLFVPWSHISATGDTWLGLARFNIGQPTLTSLSLPAAILANRK